MPDWTYHTVFRPIGRRLPYSTAQQIAFGAMGRLGQSSVGRLVIRFMGQAEPPDAVTISKGNWKLKSPVALGAGLDLHNQATSALCLFGFGIVELGPVVAGDESAQSTWQQQGLEIPLQSGVTIRTLQSQLSKQFSNGVQRFIRIVCDRMNQTEIETVMDQSGTQLEGVSLQLPRGITEEESRVLVELVHERKLKCILVIRSDDADLIQLASRSDADGILIETVNPDSETRGDLSAETLQAVAAVLRRESWDNNKLLIAAGGVQQPVDAVKLYDAGADVVMVDSGFAAAGPGLPKRINNAYAARVAQQANTARVPATQASWLWSMLLGFSLTIGGLMAVAFGTTRVVLPYDEEFLGMAREEICGINPKLLPFMSHDRVTLSGTMLALGPLYLFLSWYGDRQGMHWARVAIYGSSVAGFLSFFLFLGFGYFDPFHAFICAILFQFITLGIRSLQPSEVPQFVDLVNSSEWKRALWGQLLMIVHGTAIFFGGLVICGFGATTVFVEDDLNFMETTREALLAVNPRLVPLVAHDRASFGGMLLATGITVFLSCLWGWQQGRRWLWWGLLLTGNIAYLMTIAIHWYVGYTSLLHLLPAYGGLVVLWVALLLCRRWMWTRPTTAGV